MYETISELIERLQKAQAEYGDLPVLITSSSAMDGSVVRIDYGELPFVLCECIFLHTDITEG